MNQCLRKDHYKSVVVAFYESIIIYVETRLQDGNLGQKLGWVEHQAVGNPRSSLKNFEPAVLCREMRKRRIDSFLEIYVFLNMNHRSCLDSSRIVLCVVYDSVMFDEI